MPLKHVLRAFCVALSLVSGIVCAQAQVESRFSSNAWEPQEASQEQRADLDLQKKIEFLQQEVQELRGKVEEQTYQLQQMHEHQKKQESHQPKNVSSNTEQNTIKTLPAVIPSQQENAAEEKAYQDAYHLIQNKDYPGALLAFKSLMKTFPEGKYIPNAHYWLGEIHLTMGSLDLAYEEFNIVYKQYPQHPKAADALLKCGYVEYSKGRWKQSQQLLTQVKTQFPGTTSAQLADLRLEKLQYEGHK